MTVGALYLLTENDFYAYMHALNIMWGGHIIVLMSESIDHSK